MVNLTCRTGIRRQPRHTFPRDLCKERDQCRASFPYHGPSDQGAHGHHNRQYQANSPDRARPGCAERIWRRLLLDASVRRVGERGYSYKRPRVYVCVPGPVQHRVWYGKLMLMVMALFNDLPATL